MTLPDLYDACPLGYGCMRISDDAQRGKLAVAAAFDAGYRLFDHADIYGEGRSEVIFGEVLKERPEMRQQILIQGKVGIRFPESASVDDSGKERPAVPARYDFSRDHLTRAVEGSLQRLGVDHLHLLLLHRIDLLADPAEVGEVLGRLHGSGKVGAFGVSNCTPSQLRMLQAHSPVPLAANQVEINLDRIDALTDGTLDQCLELGVRAQAWCPLGGVAYDAWSSCATPSQRALVTAELKAQAARLDTDPVTVALAWLLRHPARIMPLIGSTTPHRIRAALKATAIEYSRDDWYRLHEARLGQPVP